MRPNKDVGYDRQHAFGPATPDEEVVARCLGVGMIGSVALALLYRGESLATALQVASLVETGRMSNSG